MKVKVSKLQGAALDWTVALANGQEEFWTTDNYSTNWTLAGPIIEREGISINSTAMRGTGGNFAWCATRIEGPAVSEEYGLTPLIAAMRCFVASKLGDEVEIPDDIGAL